MRQQILFEESRGHSTAPVPFGTDTYSTITGTALSEAVWEWCEDVNHRQHYTIILEDDQRAHQAFDVSTIVGTMSRMDRGSPLWIRRAKRRFPASPVGSYKRTTGTVVPGQGNWVVENWGGSQINGTGNGYTTATVIPAPVYPTLPSKSLVNFDLYSPKGWRRYQPLNPKVSTSQFIAELREFPRIPFLFFERANFFRSLGSEYLNLEFGWKPFVSDVRSFFKEFLSFNDRYEQLVRDNGKPVRRRGPIFSNIDTSSSTVTSGDGIDWNTPIFPTWVYGGSSGFQSIRTITTTVEQQYSFAGRFRYYLAPFDTTRYNEQIARIVYGVDLTPRLLYELLPWSWLLDWATSIGDSLSNLLNSVQDGLVADYAYTMGTYRMTEETTVAGPLATTTSYSIQEIKARDQATPYGFGLNVSTFSSRQKAILAALLLARS